MAPLSAFRLTSPFILPFLQRFLRTAVPLPILTTGAFAVALLSLRRHTPLPHAAG